MTILNFDWAYFWQTANYTSWYEWLALICFVCAWRRSVKTSLRTKQFTGKSVAFLWLFILACCFGVCHHLFVDLNFKILFYVVGLCGSISDYCVCRRLRLEQNINERKQVLTGQNDRDWSYGSDAYKKSVRGKHRHSRHREDGHRRSKDKSRMERSENGNDDAVSSKLDEIKFDDV